MRYLSSNRGPHGTGLYLKLAISDPASIAGASSTPSDGHQPMSNEDGTVWIVFNIYNFASLSDDPIFPRVSLSAPVRKLSSTPGKSTVKVALKDRGLCFLRHFR